MAKSQKHSNREAKKPKQIKVAAPVAADGLLGRANTVKPGNNKRG